MKRLCCWLLLLVVPVPAQSLSSALPQLQPVEVLRGHFAQEKQLIGFRNVLRSSGTFLVSRDRGVIWDTQKPFRTSMVIGPSGLRLDDQSPEAVPGAALERINRLLIALVGGRLDDLRREFELQQMDGSGHGWALQLHVRDPQLARKLVDVQLSGEHWVEAVSFSDERGNRTSIRFTEQSAEPAELSPEEVARFE